MSSLAYSAANDEHTLGIERDLKKFKLRLDCVLMITSVIPPELSMELSLAVNASSVTLLRFEGVTGIDESDKPKFVDVKDTGKDTTLRLAAAYALIRLDDGMIVGDPMESTTLEALY
ncbi:hypothetical protein EDB19DRAFT_1899188 [Suillus lakei]|nr:hypothetical protein EDB19DRAFT_1899188 [Suillus lakei]